MIKKRAVISWLTKEEGGRIRPPAGIGVPPYATVVRFLDSNEPWPPKEAWSLVVEKDPSLSKEYQWISNVYFLVNDGPHEMLSGNREFALYEGNKCVARGRIIDDGMG
jgi:hypothetical protein